MLEVLQIQLNPKITDVVGQKPRYIERKTSRQTDRKTNKHKKKTDKERQKERVSPRNWGIKPEPLRNGMRMQYCERKKTNKKERKKR